MPNTSMERTREEESAGFNRRRARRSAQPLRVNMSTRRYFQLSLLLPVVMGLLGLYVQSLSILWAALLGGSIIYVPLALVAASKLRRVESKEQLRSFVLTLPLIFSALLGTLYGAAFLLMGDGMSAFAFSVPVAVLSAVISYGYVLFACLGWHTLKAIGVVKDELVA